MSSGWPWSPFGALRALIGTILESSSRLRLQTEALQRDSADAGKPLKNLGLFDGWQLPGHQDTPFGGLGGLLGSSGRLQSIP